MRKENSEIVRKLHKYSKPFYGDSFALQKNYLQVNANVFIVVHKEVTIERGMDSSFQLKSTLRCMI